MSQEDGNWERIPSDETVKLFLVDVDKRIVDINAELGDTFSYGDHYDSLITELSWLHDYKYQYGSVLGEAHESGDGTY